MSAVYLVLLISVIFPHHHHEDIVCYTKTHCEADDHPAENNHEDFSDHHNDHNTSEESEQCFSLEYYVLAAPGKNLRELVFLVVNNTYGDDPLATVYNIEYSLDFYSSCDFPYLKSHYTAYLKHHIPLRAPPATLA